MRTRVDAPPPLPEPRGEISELVLATLTQPPHDFSCELPRHGDVLAADDDFHLALYALYELHYRSFDGVDDGWEFEPSLLKLRADLEHAFEGALRAAIPTDRPGDIPAQLRAMLDAAEVPSLSRFL